MRPGGLVVAIRRAHERLGGAIEPLTDAQVGQPSRLPGWSRGHVLAHLDGLAAAIARQIDCARRGELVDFYDGGRPARDAAIEAGASAPAAEHVHALRVATERIDALLAGLAPADWDRPVRFRDGVVLSVALAWWREVEIHLVDLDLGPDSDEWSAELCDHLVDFLATRVPAGSRVVLEAPDGWRRDLGAGAARTVRGDRADLTAWLAGREPVRAIRAADGDHLPRLDPWPDSTPPEPPAATSPDLA
ncbi:maleylpyruvate isomerase family mycothiol-dependent enzyme [Pengzhenrongella frigida]|uniref:Maleylpyruvate isomerase family mycothiol-dependent enzyme n=1 Tax=Pengzhenrongella frigida TaxID=1259133 RepID=A0A4Q5MX18_9MICO|nr:maleylpyruvate isomerase family mycothiol-dependent enzyme [Cellulomonas sp. HLT2-17]